MLQQRIRCSIPLLRRVLLAIALWAPKVAVADDPEPLSKYVVNEADPESSIPTPAEAMRDPLQMGYLMMDLADKAQRAEKRSDFAAALKYYRAMAKAVPDRAISFSKMCRAHQELGDLPQALESCRTALGLGGVTVDDFIRFVRIVVAQPGAIEPARLREVDSAIAHIATQLGDGPNTALTTNHLKCELAVWLGDTTRLQACTRELATLAPKDPKTLTFEWALALRRNDLEAGWAVVERAKQTDMPKEGIRRMQEGLLAAERSAPELLQTVREKWWLAAFPMAALLGIGLALLGRRKGRLQTA